MKNVKNEHFCWFILLSKITCFFCNIWTKLRLMKFVATAAMSEACDVCKSGKVLVFHKIIIIFYFSCMVEYPLPLQPALRPAYPLPAHPSPIRPPPTHTARRYPRSARHAAAASCHFPCSKKAARTGKVLAGRRLSMIMSFFGENRSLNGHF